MQHTKTVEDWEYKVERFMWTLRGQGWIFTRNGKNSRGQANSPKNQLKDFVIKTIHTAVLAREAEIREIIDGLKEVYREDSEYHNKGDEKDHSESIGNEVLDELLDLLTPPSEV